MSYASSNRKNDGKTDSDHKKIERKGMGIFRITTDCIKFKAVETGHKRDGSNTTLLSSTSLFHFHVHSGNRNFCCKKSIFHTPH